MALIPGATSSPSSCPNHPPGTAQPQEGSGAGGRSNLRTRTEGGLTEEPGSQQAADTHSKEKPLPSAAGSGCQRALELQIHLLGAKQPRQNVCILPFTLHSKCASFSGHRKSTLYQVSLYTRNLDSLEVVFFHIHKTHFIYSLSIVLRACRDPGGRDRALLGYQTQSNLQLQTTGHPTTAPPWGR